jgi:hypothetical protein
MKAKKKPVAIPERVEWRPKALYDRTIAALALLDVDALSALQQECESMGEPGILYPQDAANLSEKHQLLAKLLLQTRQNLRVLRQVCVAPGTYVGVAMPDGRERATWQP